MSDPYILTYFFLCIPYFSRETLTKVHTSTSNFERTRSMGKGPDLLQILIHVNWSLEFDLKDLRPKTEIFRKVSRSVKVMCLAKTRISERPCQGECKGDITVTPASTHHGAGEPSLLNTRHHRTLARQVKVVFVFKQSQPCIMYEAKCRMGRNRSRFISYVWKLMVR